ncbi:MAG: PH domain-containing protein, partial [Candidatus Limnocylindrales bacterium]
LRGDERLIWEGRPDARAYVLRGAWYLVPFSLMWGGFAIFWEYTALRSGAPPFFVLWGIPFVAIGLYMIVGRPLGARHEAQRTVYALTDRRVLIIGGAFGRSIVELDLRDLPPSQLDERSDGIGTITFGGIAGAFRAPPGWPTMGMSGRTPAFVSIPDARRVYALLQDAREVARDQR